MKKGDSVSVINDNLTGTVKSIQGTQVIIEDQHGFEYEYSLQELVVKDDEIYKEVSIFQKEESNKSISKKHNKKPFVLDLHFQTISKNSKNVDPFERLFMQKEKLLNTLDYCRENNLKKLEIIHGIGDGVLQQMVYDVLESQTNIEFHNKEILHHQSGTVLVYLK